MPPAASFTRFEVVDHERTHLPIARGRKRRRGVRVGTPPSVKTLSVDSGKAERLPRSGEPRGGGGNGASGSGGLERAADQRPLGHRLRPGAWVIFRRADAGRSSGTAALPRDTRSAA